MGNDEERRMARIVALQAAVALNSDVSLSVRKHWTLRDAEEFEQWLTRP